MFFTSPKTIKKLGLKSVTRVRSGYSITPDLSHTHTFDPRSRKFQKKIPTSEGHPGPEKQNKTKNNGNGKEEKRK